MLAFRSLVIPLTAGLMNLVSIGAAFGVVSAVFEKGWGASLVGLDGEVPIVSFVPLMMFAILFGLSMDYEVFLMTHIREAWQQNARQPGGGHHRRRHDGPGHHVGGADHGQCVLRVHHQRRPDRQAVRRRHGRRRGGRRDARALPAGAGGDGADRPANWWFPRFLDRIVPDFSIEGDSGSASAMRRRRPRRTPRRRRARRCRRRPPGRLPAAADRGILGRGAVPRPTPGSGAHATGPRR